MSRKRASASKNGEYQKPPTALVLELEFMLFRGWQLMYKAFSSVLKNHSIAFNQIMFSRYCLPRTIEAGLQNLLLALGKKELAAQNIAEKIKQLFLSSLMASSAQPSPGIMALFKKAAENNIKIGLLSFLPPENNEQLLKRLSLKQPAFLQVVKKEADYLPTADIWLSLLKAMSVLPRCAIALVNSAPACKSALAVGMRCCAVPDLFTDWQDFSGADLVKENISDLKLNEIVALLTSAPFRERTR